MIIDLNEEKNEMFFQMENITKEIDQMQVIFYVK